MKDKICLVTGAGASIPYGFPSGRELVKYISKFEPVKNKLWGYFRNGDIKNFKRNWFDLRCIATAMEICNIKDALDKLKSFKDLLIEVEPTSIDVFLERNRDFMDVGKFVLAWYFVFRENQNYLEMNKEKASGGDPESDADWYRYLWSFLYNNFNIIENGLLSIVTYNYDRSLEDFLYNKLVKTLGVDEGLKLFKRLAIIHLHGSLGQIDILKYGAAGLNDFPDISNGQDGISILESFRDIFISITDKFKILFEAEESSYKDGNELLKAAKYIYILGFGFGKENIDNLGLPSVTKHSRFTIASGYKRTANEIRIKTQLFGSKSSIKIHADKGIIDFLRNHSIIVN